MADKINIAIASDHWGVDLKSALIESQAEMNWKDFGPNSTDAVDYPDFADLVCEQITSGEADMGVLICGSGLGMSMRANRYPGVRAALCFTEEMAYMAREHNNANVLVLAAKWVDSESGIKIINQFLSSVFAGGRHERRVAKIDTPIASKKES